MNGPISTDPLASEININVELSAVRSQIRGLHAMSLDLCTDLLALLAPMELPVSPVLASRTVTAAPVARRQVVQVTRAFDSVERGLMEITEGTRSLPAAAPQLALQAALVPLPIELASY